MIIISIKKHCYFAPFYTHIHCVQAAVPVITVYHGLILVTMKTNQRHFVVLIVKIFINTIRATSYYAML